MSGYWLFDTNCLSLLLTEFKNGNSTKIEELVNGNKILLTHLTLSELRLKQSLWSVLPDFCHNFNCYFVNSETVHELEIKFGGQGITYEEWFRPNNLTEELFNQIDTLQIPLKDDRLIKKSLSSLYLKPVNELIFLREDEVDTEMRLVTEIRKKISESGLKVNPLWMNSEFFPYNYVHRYLIYRRYILNFGTKLQGNDLYDLATSSISVFCDRYYSERSFISTLREVKGKIPKSPIEIAKRKRKIGTLSEVKFEKFTDDTFIFRESRPLLEKTEFFNLSELKLFFQPSP